MNGKKVRGRKYPWYNYSYLFEFNLTFHKRGVIEVENEAHCDFVKLRQMLIRTHMEELRDKTSDVLYENYRSSKLNTASGLDTAKYILVDISCIIQLLTLF